MSKKHYQGYFILNSKHRPEAGELQDRLEVAKMITRDNKITLKYNYKEPELEERSQRVININYFSPYLKALEIH